MISTLVNLNDYPLDNPESPQYRAITQHWQSELHEHDFVNMEGFLSNQGIGKIASEIDDRIDQAFHSARFANPYGQSRDDVDDSCNHKQDHPSHIYAKTDRYGLARHQLQNTSLDALYSWLPMQRFVREILGLKELYLHEDPSNALVVQIYKNGGGLAWHFDRALFSTILNIRETNCGGIFECAPGLRSEEDPCFDDVRDVLLEQSKRVQQHNVKSGSFTIMRGRYTMHRVTENRGDASRLSAVLSYEDKPGVKLDEATRKIFFGPTAPDDHNV